MTVTISSTSPADNETVDKWPAYIRAIGVLLGGSLNPVSVTVGQTYFTVGVDLRNIIVDIVLLNCDAGAGPISNILNGTEGQMKVFIVQSGELIFNESGNIDLNQVRSSNITLEENDMIFLLNFGGDPTTGAQGTWREMYRNFAVDGS